MCVCKHVCAGVYAGVWKCVCMWKHVHLSQCTGIFLSDFSILFFSDTGSHTEPKTHNSARLAGPSALSLPAYLGTEAMWNHHTQLLHGAGDLNLGPCSYAVSTLLTASSAPFFFLSRSYCVALAGLSSLCTPDWPLIYHRLACSTH